MRTFKLTVVASIVSLSVVAAANAESTTADTAEGSRLALVIGNNDYTFAPLRSPVKDAIDMRNRLKKAGFRVTACFNCTLKETKRKIERFTEDLRTVGSNAKSVFYYSGHGMQIKGRNYLVPTDFRLPTNELRTGVGNDIIEKRVKERSISIDDDIRPEINTAKPKISMVILDACRNNPVIAADHNTFTSSGLAATSTTTGEFIAYAAQPGATAADGGKGNNSLFTKHIFKIMSTAGMPLTTMFEHVAAGVRKESHQRQQPWTASSLTGPFAFNECPRNQVFVDQFNSCRYVTDVAVIPSRPMTP